MREVYPEIQIEEVIYQADSEGNVRAKHFLDKQWRKWNENVVSHSHGYLEHRCIFDRKSYRQYVHRLVAISAMVDGYKKLFIEGYRASPYVVDHINGSKDDNRTENLRVITREENSSIATKQKKRIP